MGYPLVPSKSGSLAAGPALGALSALREEFAWRARSPRGCQSFRLSSCLRVVGYSCWKQRTACPRTQINSAIAQINMGLSGSLSRGWIFLGVLFLLSRSCGGIRGTPRGCSPASPQAASVSSFPREQQRLGSLLTTMSVSRIELFFLDCVLGTPKF